MGQTVTNVWVAGDGVRVNPETGLCIEDRADIHADYPTGDYRHGNGVWDGRRGLLHAARNEFAALQVIVEADGPVAGVSVQFNRLTGPDGAELSGRNVALFKAWYVEVKQASTGYEETSLGPGWYPDALIPAPPGEPVTFDLPCPENGIGASQHNQTVWVDVYVPRDRGDAPPGAYTGELVITWSGGERRLPVELTVWDFALPDKIHCRGDIFNTSLKGMDPALERKYYHLCRRHRFLVGESMYRPDLAVNGADVSIDWADYDARVGPYLDGSAFSESAGYWGPGVGLSIDHLLLPFDAERGEQIERAWPMVTPSEGPTAEYEAVWVEAARQVREHFDAHPEWASVERIVFIDALDESYNEAAYQKMIYYCELLRRGMGEGWFKYRIDGGYSCEAMETLKNHVDLWICHTIGFDAEKMAHFREQGVEPWFYGPMIYEREANSACGSNTFTDLDLFTGRGIGWAAWKHRCGYCEWEFDYNADTAWREALNYRKKDLGFNGSGQLIYRGSEIGSDDPIPSIRLKAHRRGFQDYEYFRLLREAGLESEADRLANSIIHTTPFGKASVGNTEIWQNDPDAWDAARIEAGNLLHSASLR